MSAVREVLARVCRAGHYDNDEFLQLTCLRCGVTVCGWCEGGGPWDQTATEIAGDDGHVGICDPCSNALDLIFFGPDDLWLRAGERPYAGMLTGKVRPPRGWGNARPEHRP